MNFSNGDKYNGKWNNDKRYGPGIYTYSNGEKYDGEWINDKKQGKGICIVKV